MKTRTSTGPGPRKLEHGELPDDVEREEDLNGTASSHGPPPDERPAEPSGDAGSPSRPAEGIE